MQIQSLRYFLKVATTGSFLATARHFEVPASSVSRFIAALEKELGQQLFYRSTRAVRLTEQGQLYYTHVREAIELLDSAADQLDQKSTVMQGLLRINAPESLGRMHIAELVNQLQIKYPDLMVELMLTNTFVDPVQEGADITIRTGRLIDSGLIGKVVCTHRYLLAASPDYLASHGVPDSPDELLEHDCLLYKGLLEPQKWYFRCSSEEPFSSLVVNGPLRSNDAEVLVKAAVAGRGIVLMPSWLFPPACFRQGKLVNLLSAWEFSRYADKSYVQILSPGNRQLSQKVRVACAFLIDAIGNPPYWDDL